MYKVYVCSFKVIRLNLDIVWKEVFATLHTYWRAEFCNEDPIGASPVHKYLCQLRPLAVQ